ncbi:MAG: hypothetical protein WAN12_20430 [Candidatus Acidiferrum sp.]
MTTTIAKGWSVEQETTIKGYMAKGMSRSNAVRKMKNEIDKAHKAAARITPKVVEEHKAKAAKPVVSKGDAKHYDQAAVIEGFLKHGKTISELAAEQKMSHVYCHRILTTKVPKEYAAEQAKRKAACEAAKKAEAK